MIDWFIILNEGQMTKPYTYLLLGLLYKFWCT